MENLQSNLLYSLAGAAAVASLASCANKQKSTEQKPLNIVYTEPGPHRGGWCTFYSKLCG